MATKVKKTRLKEAEPMMDQTMAPAPAQPATQADMAAAPGQPVDPAVDYPVDEQAAPVAEEPAVEGDSPIEVEPETVSMEVKVPTDQIAAAVAQSTGDVVPAETAPDAMATQEADLVQATAPTEETPVAEGGEAAATDMTAGQPTGEPAPAVMESKKVKKTRIKEDFGELDASEAAEKHDEDKLEKIIDTGVKNQGEGEGFGTTGQTSDGNNRLDLIKTGVDNMEESLEDDDIDTEDVEEPVEEEEAPVEDKIKSAGIVDTEELPSLGDDEADEELDDLFDEPVEEPDDDEFINKIEDFLGTEDIGDVADTLRNTASFLDQIAKEPGEESLNFKDLVDGLEDDEDTEDEEPASEKSILDAIDKIDIDADDEDVDFDDFEDDDVEDDDIDIEEPEEEELEESYRRPVYSSRRQTRKPYVTQGHPLKESSIIYPAGSEPLGNVPKYAEDDYDVVRRQERLSQSRREAIKNYRRSVLNESRKDASRTRFNEALRSSVKSVRNGETSKVNPKSWEANTFASKYDESQRLDYKELLKNHFLG